MTGVPSRWFLNVRPVGEGCGGTRSADPLPAFPPLPVPTSPVEWLCRPRPHGADTQPRQQTRKRHP